MSAVARASTRPAGASWEALGTSVVLRVTDAGALAPARAALERELDAVDRACSRFRDDSELARVNASAGRVTAAGELFLDALALALRAAELTDGAVDPTVGRALELAGYDRDWSLLDPPVDRDRNLPDAPLPRAPGATPGRSSDTGAGPPIVTARVLADWRAVALDRALGTVRIPAGIKLDLGATAKAWAADRGAAACAAAGDCGALVSLGGDVATCGQGPSGGWRIHVTDDHRSEPSAPGQTVSIASGGLATSSTAVRRWRHGARTMHHIIDPGTGEPAVSKWRTVSVAAGVCADANIAATASLVRPETAPAWLAELGLPARLVAANGEVTLVGEWPTPEASA
ncbi:MAG TPA: FAD:protein FMN transferase [Solirubrobacteraceae bacterium]|jgi:thiamine biosynthesis lipoprotein